MKRLLLVFCAGLLALQLTGCAFFGIVPPWQQLQYEMEAYEEATQDDGDDSSSTARPSADASSAAPSSSQAAPSSSPAPPASSAAPSEPQIFIAGSYACKDDSKFSPGYYPTVDLYNDGSFTVMVNLLEGMGNLTGRFEYDGTHVYLYVETRDFMGFAGDDVDLLVFEVLDKDRLMWTGESISVSEYGDVFTRV